MGGKLSLRWLNNSIALFDTYGLVALDSGLEISQLITTGTETEINLRKVDPQVLFR